MCLPEAQLKTKSRIVLQRFILLHNSLNHVLSGTQWFKELAKFARTDHETSMAAAC